jgi:uncharacterized membrane protein
MATDITSDVHIRASVEEVWALTVDVEGWPALTPTMTSIERLDDGPLRVGSAARVVQPRQRPTVWTVSRIEAPNVFEWKAKVLGVTMTGVHHVEAEGDGCHNHLGLRLSGFGSGVLRRLLGGTFRSAIETENQGFKRGAEAAHSANAAG